MRVTVNAVGEHHGLHPVARGEGGPIEQILVCSCSANGGSGIRRYSCNICHYRETLVIDDQIPGIVVVGTNLPARAVLSYGNGCREYACNHSHNADNNQRQRRYFLCGDAT